LQIDGEINSAAAETENELAKKSDELGLEFLYRWMYKYAQRE
jgi:hypothetical protein